MSNQILIIEDEPKIASLLSDYLQHAGYQPRPATPARTAWPCCVTSLST